MSGKAALLERYGERNLRWYDRVTLITQLAAFTVGFLQMKHVAAGFVTNYGGDITGTLMIQLMLARTVFAVRSRAFLLASLVAWGGSLAWELCQLVDFAGTPLAFTSGTFDPLDILAYTAAVMIGALIDLLARTRRTTGSAAA